VPDAAGLRLTVKVRVLVPELPSDTEASVIDNVGVAAASSLVIVPTAWPSAKVTPVDGFDRLTVKVSSGSAVVSPLIVTAKVFEVAPAAMRRPAVVLAT
jgi:hypothetical protein